MEMESSVALWNQLPFNLVKRVLSFLSVPELCRYSVVCKRWNELIRNPEFGAQCAQNAAKRDASFIVFRYYHIIPIDDPSPKPHGGWAFLDLSTQRWYRVEDDASKEIRHRLYPGVYSMDGGLVCQNSATNHTELSNSEGNSVVVYNPIAKTLKQLPTAPTHGASNHFPGLHLMVDSHNSQSFKVFLINHTFDGSDLLEDPETSQELRSLVLNDPFMRVYDSTTNEWKSLPNPSCIQRAVYEVTSVLFQGFLYLYVSSVSDGEPGPLWRYNLAEETWENVVVEISSTLCGPQLMVCANRLLLAAWKADQFVLGLGGVRRGKVSKFCSLELSEIKITGTANKVTSLFRMANADTKDFFDIITEASQNYHMIICALGNSVLFISCYSRKSMVFDLGTLSWRPGPQISSDHISRRKSCLLGSPGPPNRCGEGVPCT